jgi:CBS domain-containing protein
MPVEGHLSHVVTIGQVANPEVPVCEPSETIAGIRKRLRGGHWETCVVVNADRVVLGLLRKDAWEEAASDMPAEQVMDPAPSTFRPHLTREEMASTMQKKKMKTALVTTPDGKLLGLLRRKDLE